MVWHNLCFLKHTHTHLISMYMIYRETSSQRVAGEERYRMSKGEKTHFSFHAFLYFWMLYHVCISYWKHILFKQCINHSFNLSNTVSHIQYFLINKIYPWSLKKSTALGSEWQANLLFPLFLAFRVMMSFLIIFVNLKLHLKGTRKTDIKRKVCSFFSGFFPQIRETYLLILIFVWSMKRSSEESSYNY